MYSEKEIDQIITSKRLIIKEKFSYYSLSLSFFAPPIFIIYLSIKEDELNSMGVILISIMTALGLLTALYQAPRLKKFKSLDLARDEKAYEKVIMALEILKWPIAYKKEQHFIIADDNFKFSFAGSAKSWRIYILIDDGKVSATCHYHPRPQAPVFNIGGADRVFSLERTIKSLRN